MEGSAFDFLAIIKTFIFGLVAAEALAERNPVLKGPSEHAAWFVVW